MHPARFHYRLPDSALATIVSAGDLWDIRQRSGTHTHINSVDSSHSLGYIGLHIHGGYEHLRPRHSPQPQP